MDVSLRRWPDAPPPAHQSHEIVSLVVSEGNEADPDDPRFALTFVTASGKRLCVRLPSDQLQSLADVLYRLAQEERWQ